MDSSANQVIPVNLVTPAGETRRLGRRHRIRALGAVTAAAVVLSGCIKAELSIDVRGDETADVDFLIAQDAALFESLGSMAGELSDDSDLAMDVGECDDFLGDAITVTAEPYEEGEWKGVRCRASGVPVADLNAAMSEDGGTWELRRDGGGWAFDATLTRDVMGADGADGAGDPAGDAMARAMFRDAKLVVRVSAPGDLGDTNATSVSGRTATWELSFLDLMTADTTMSARWSGGGGAFAGGGFGVGLLALMIGGLVGLAVLGGVLALVLRRKPVPPPPPAPAAGPWAAPPAGPWAPPPVPGANRPPTDPAA